MIPKSIPSVNQGLKSGISFVTLSPDTNRELAKSPELRNGKRFIYKVDDFFDKELKLRVFKDVKKMEHFPNFLAGNNNIFRVPILGGSRGIALESPVVVFDSSCKIENKEILNDFIKIKNTPKSVLDFTFSSLEKMAFMGNWSSQEIPVTSFFLRYTLNSDTDKITNMEWHEDLNCLSMTAVISPYKQDDGEFSGGEISFGQREQDFKTYFGLGVTSRTVLPNTVKTFSYPENGCFFFENLWSQHRVNDIQLTAGSSCERMLFSIFASPNPEQLSTFVFNSDCTNLV